MKYWQRNRNYRKYENSDDTFTYIITVDGVSIEVEEDVYKVYAQADRRERYCTERDAGRLLSLERMDDDDVLLSYLTDLCVESAEETAIRGLITEQAAAAFQALDEEDKLMLQALVINNVTERQYAEQIGLSQKGINKRKHRALKKIRKIFGTQTD